MLVSLKWLKELVDVPVSVPELVDRLDLTGTAVESAKSAGAALDHIAVGQIVSKEQHPEADKLWVTKVDVGGEEQLQIVCGAQNFNAGDKVPVAMVGATLPDGMTIKKAKLRGIESRGMNCSARELGLGDDHEGLMILPPDAPVGMPFAEYAGLSDTILELEITPNRPDCLSVAGVAREVGAVFDRVASMPSSAPAETGEPAADSVTVTIDDPDMCPRYTARLIRNVKIGPSPAWLSERVNASGARSISNIVDITNYVMFELGQPLHAFDADLLAKDASGKIAIGVRSAAEGEHLTTLDGQDRDADRRHAPHHRPHRSGGARRRHGRGVDRGSRGDRQRAARVRLLQPGLHLAHEPPPRAVLRGVLALREGRGPRVLCRRPRPRSSTDGRALRRPGRARRRRHLPRSRCRCAS